MSPLYKLLGLTLLATVLLPAAYAWSEIEINSEKVTWSICDRPGSRVIRRGSQDSGAKTLNLWHCGISSLHVSDLQGLPNLSGIMLYWNNIETLDADVFRRTPNLIYLDVNNNKLEKVPVFGASSVLPNVRNLIFKENRISKLDDTRTFSSTKKLKNLDLSKNQIEYIHPEIFSGLTELETVQLEQNKLTNIADKTFALSSLEFVYLSKNLIANVDLGAFGGCQLISLGLDNNKLTKLPDDFFECAGVRLVSLCAHDNPWQCSYLPKLTAKRLRCSGGSAPVCST